MGFIALFASFVAFFGFTAYLIYKLSTIDEKNN